MEGELTQQTLAAWRDADQNDAAIVAPADAADEAARFKTVEQFDQAVVLELEALGEVADGGFAGRRSALDGEKQLVVLRLETGGACGLLAEVQEAADLISEFGQGLIFGVPHDDEKCSRSPSSSIVIRQNKGCARELSKSQPEAAVRGSIEGFSEGVLGFDDGIAEVLVEGMGAVADDIRAQADGTRAAPTRPFFGVLGERAAKARAAVLFVDHQAAEFDGRAGFQREVERGVNPANDLPGNVDDGDELSGIGEDEGQAGVHVRGRGRIAELGGERGKGRGVFGTRGADGRRDGR